MHAYRLIQHFRTFPPSSCVPVLRLCILMALMMPHAAPGPLKVNSLTSAVSPGSGSSDRYAQSQRAFVGVNRKSAQLCKPAIVSHLKVQEAQYFWQLFLCSKCKTINWWHDHHQCFAVVKILPQTQPANCSNPMYAEIMMVIDKTVLFCLGFRQTQ